MSQTTCAVSYPISGKAPAPNSAREESLIQKCKSGDRSAWNALIDYYRKDIYRFALFLSRNVDDAEDITSQVFLRLYLSLHTFHDENAFRPWLLCIVRRTFLDMCVRPVHRSHLPIECVRSTDDEFSMFPHLRSPSATPEEDYIEKETDQILSRAIQQLPLLQRNMLTLYYEIGSYSEIAQETGIPVGTVKSRLNRARVLLRRKLVYVQAVTAKE